MKSRFTATVTATATATATAKEMSGWKCVGGTIEMSGSSPARWPRPLPPAPL